MNDSQSSPPVAPDDGSERRRVETLRNAATPPHTCEHGLTDMCPRCWWGAREQNRSDTVVPPWEGRVDPSTPGPWCAWDRAVGWEVCHFPATSYRDNSIVDYWPDKGTMWPADAQFIAAARNLRMA